MDSGTSAELSDVWGSSGSDDVFAVGSDFDGGNYHGTILHTTTGSPGLQ